MATAKNEQPKTKAGEEIQKAMDKVTEQGFYGVEVDPTPNEHYTVAGVTAKKPTPETNAESAAKAQAYASAIRRPGDGPGTE